jgi:hypothetical protein
MYPHRCRNNVDRCRTMVIEVKIFSDGGCVRVRNVLQRTKLLKYHPSRLLKTLQTRLPYLDHGVDRGENRRDKKRASTMKHWLSSGGTLLAAFEFARNQ